MTNKYIELFKSCNSEEFPLLYFTTLKNNPQDLELIVEAFQQPEALPQKPVVVVVVNSDSEYNSKIKLFNNRGIKMPRLKASADEAKFREHVIYWTLVHEKNRKAANEWLKSKDLNSDELYNKCIELINEEY